MDLLTAWGIAQAAGFLFKPVLEDLAKDAGVVKDYVKNSFGSVFKAASKSALTKAHGKAIKELLQLIQDELIVNGIAEHEVEAWNDDVKLFIQGQGVQQILREAFSSVAAAVDAGLLAKSWQQMPIRNIRDEEKELRDLLAAQAAGEMAEALQNQTGIAPDLDLEKYRESLLESHQHLKLELLDPNGSSYKVQLRSVFVPQTVRDCQEYIPQVFEIPKEQLTRLRKEGGLDEAMLDLAEDLIESRRRGYLDQSPRSVLEVVADSRHFHLVILGSPGAGKSTLLKALALE
jgi:hypothetical protein